MVIFNNYVKLPEGTYTEKDALRTSLPRCLRTQTRSVAECSCDLPRALPRKMNVSVLSASIRNLFEGAYPLVICYSLLLKMAIEIVDLPINSMVIFP